MLVGKPERKTPLGRAKHRWEYGGKMWTGCIWLRIGTSDGSL